MRIATVNIDDDTDDVTIDGKSFAGHSPAAGVRRRGTMPVISDFCASLRSPLPPSGYIFVWMNIGDSLHELYKMIQRLRKELL